MLVPSFEYDSFRVSFLVPLINHPTGGFLQGDWAHSIPFPTYRTDRKFPPIRKTTNPGAS